MKGIEPLPRAASPAALEWQVHPARRRPGAAAAALGVIALVSAAAASYGAWWGAGAAVLLVLSLHRFFFPSRFHLDEQGIAARDLFSSRSLAWSEVRRFACDRHGGYLSTRRQPSRLDAFRGLHVLFDERRELLIGEIRRRLPAREARS